MSSSKPSTPSSMGSSTPQKVPGTPSSSRTDSARAGSSSSRSRPPLSGRLASSRINSSRLANEATPQPDPSSNPEEPKKKKKPAFKYEKPYVDSSFLNWVTINFRFLAIRFFNFTVELPVTTTFAAIEQIILQHHQGTIGNLYIYKDKVSKENWLNARSQPTRTLLDSGVIGGTKEENVQMKIFYDCEPLELDCPLLHTNLLSSAHGQEELEPSATSVSSLLCS